MRAWIPIGMVLLLAGLSGCTTVHGSWEFRSIEPQTAMRDFGISRLVLEKDGDYTADIKMNGRQSTSHGTFTYDASEKRLVLKPAEGKTREYHAEYCAPCKALKVWSATEPKDWEAKFNRVDNGKEQDNGPAREKSGSKDARHSSDEAWDGEQK